jgi:GntR family transcriptional regulator
MDESTIIDLFKKNILEEQNNLPIYYRIMILIKHHIQTGALKPGDMLPPESKLCEIYSVSRTTIRQAMDQLAEENLISRHRGRGSYIASPKLQRNINHLYSFSEDMRSMGLTPTSRVVESAVVPAAGSIAEIMNIPVNSDVFKLVRIRYASNEPILLENTYIPYYLCNGILHEDFSVASLYGILKYKYNLKIKGAIEKYEAGKMDKNTAQMLQSSSSNPVFIIRRTAYLEDDIPFEYTHSTMRSDKCVFTVELAEGKNQVYFSREITP